MTMAVGHPSGKSVSSRPRDRQDTDPKVSARALLQLWGVAGAPRWSCALHTRLGSQGEGPRPGYGPPQP